MTAVVIIGGSILMLLGVAHAALTLTSNPTRGALAPTNPEVQAAMQVSSGLGMAPKLDTTLWKAWVGFNLSHAVGVIVVAATIVFHAARDIEAATSQPLYLVLTLVLPWIYLLISVRYWFARPTRGIVVGATLVTLGTIGTLLG